MFTIEKTKKIESKTVLTGKVEQFAGAPEKKKENAGVRGPGGRVTIETVATGDTANPFAVTITDVGNYGKDRYGVRLNLTRDELLALADELAAAADQSVVASEVAAPTEASGTLTEPEFNQPESAETEIQLAFVPSAPSDTDSSVSA